MIVHANLALNSLLIIAIISSPTFCIRAGTMSFNFEVLGAWKWLTAHLILFKGKDIVRVILDK